MTSLEKLGLPKLIGSENYIIWSIRVKAALTKEDLASPIDDNTITSGIKNNKAVALIKLLCDDGPLLYIRNIQGANEAWKKLEDLYNPKGFTTEFLILKEFFNTKLDEYNSMENYLNKVKSLVDDLRSKDIILPTQVITAWVLNSLNEDYDGFIQNITQSLRLDPNAYSIESLFSSLIDEARGRDNNGNNTGKLLVLKRNAYKKKPYSGNYCQHCKNTTHMTMNCWHLFPNKAPTNWNSRAKTLNPKGARSLGPRKIFKNKNQKNQKKQQKSNGSEFSLENQAKQTAMITTILDSDESNKILSDNPISDNGINTKDNSVSTEILPDIANVEQIDYLNLSDPELFDIAEDSPIEVCLPLISYDNNDHRAATDNILVNLVQSYIIGTKVNFIIDCAATINTVCNLNYYYKYKPCHTLVSWGKANSLIAKYKGDIILKFNTGQIYILPDVYYLPKLGVNLISLNKMVETTALITKDKAIIYKKSPKQPIAIGFKINSLYITLATILYPKGNGINQTKQDHDHTSNNTSSITSTNRINTMKNGILTINNNIFNIIKKWHIRLGHMNIISLKVFLKNTLDINISNECVKNFLLYKCRTCLLSKYNRSIYKKSIDPIQYNLLGRIHSDLGGPLPNTYNKYRYYITFLDKKSRYLWVTLLYNKNNAYRAFEQFKTLVENNDKNHKIHEFFTDNGKEYINKHFATALNNYGILHRTSPAYTKQPNGLIERINLTLFNKVRCLLIQSYSPNFLWGEALLSAVFIYNRTPHKSLGFKTPYEIYNNVLPNTKNIRVWGSICYYHTNTYITKLSPRKDEAILVGYSDYNHYKLWDYKKHKCFWSRDVTICENEFLKNSKSPKNPSPTNNIDIYSDSSIITRNNAKNTSKSSNTTGNNSQTNARKYTRSYNKYIASNPNHRIEVQIPSKDIYYSIKDTLLSDCIRAIENPVIPNIFLLTTSILQEPNTFAEAMNSSEHQEWYRACKEEVNELEKQNTYSVIQKPLSSLIPLKGRWVFKKKTIINPKKGYITNSDNTIRYKARWVIQGFNQKLGIDFLETFSTTCRTETWHLLLIIAVNKGWPILQYDVKNAFIHADIDADIYTILPIGIYSKNDTRICHLNKAIYGLKQSPRLWYNYLKNILYKFDFRVLPFDEGIYINSKTGCILVCHVDDILVIHPNIIYIRELYQKIKIYIKLEEIGLVSTFLGNNIIINYQEKTLKINQTNYISKLLTKFNIYNNIKYKPIQTPGQPGEKLRKNSLSASLADINEYQKQIGSLLYLALKTRPDITFATIYCARYMSNPNAAHYNALDRIWKYLLAYPKLGLIYNCKGNDLYIKGYSDSDWGNDLDQRKSTSGYIFSLSSDIGINNPISWNTQLQKTIALSSCEAEYMSLKDATKEAIYLAHVFNHINTSLDLGYTPSIPKILIDSDSAKKLAENPEFHKRSKHIDIIYHFTREAILQKRIEVIQIPSKYELADFLTKNVTNILHKSFVDLANLGD